MGASTGIAWTTSPRPTLGVELELQVVDAETGDLVSLANEILADGWLAGRYGLDADLIVDDPDAPTVTRVPARERIERLVAAVRPAALELGTAADLDRVLDIAARGNGAERQRGIVANGGSLADVVRHLVTELRTDQPSR